MVEVLKLWNKFAEYKNLQRFFSNRKVSQKIMIDFKNRVNISKENIM